MVKIGAQFTITNPADYRHGRTFQIVGFNAAKGGSRYAVCEDVNERGYKSSYIFYVADLSA